MRSIGVNCREAEKIQAGRVDPGARSEKEGDEHMRRLAMLLGMTMLIVMVAAGVALAIVKTCGPNALPCEGTDREDVLYERIRKCNDCRVNPNGLRDRILGFDGEDILSAVTGRDDRDVLEGGRKDDDLHTNDGDNRDAARGGRGRDTCFIDQGDATSSCERIDDTRAAGMGPRSGGTSSTAAEPSSP
jgi:hypothetical protein